MRPVPKALLAGFTLSTLTVGVIGSLGPLTSFPRLSPDPWRDYLALATAADVSAVAVYCITAFCMSCCLFVAGLCTRRHEPEPDPERAQLEEESWLPS